MGTVTVEADRLSNRDFVCMIDVLAETIDSCLKAVTSTYTDFSSRLTRLEAEVRKIADRVSFLDTMVLGAVPILD